MNKNLFFCSLSGSLVGNDISKFPELYAPTKQRKKETNNIPNIPKASKTPNPGNLSCPVDASELQGKRLLKSPSTAVVQRAMMKPIAVLSVWISSHQWETQLDFAGLFGGIWAVFLQVLGRLVSWCFAGGFRMFAEPKRALSLFL